MDERRWLLLAVAITEWAGTLAHLEVLARQGIAIPTGVQDTISRELGYLMRQWAGPLGDSPDKVLAQARAYCTEHYAEVDAVFEEGTLRG